MNFHVEHSTIFLPITIFQIFNNWYSEEKNRTSSNEREIIYLRHVPSEDKHAPNESQIRSYEMEGDIS